MIITTSAKIEGKRIVKTIGLVKGSTIRAKHLGKDVIAGLRSVVGGEIPVHPAMGKDQQGILLAAVDIFWDKDIAVKLDRIFGSHGRWIFHMGIGRTGDAHLVHMAHVADAMKPEHVVDEFLHNVHTVIVIWVAE